MILTNKKRIICSILIPSRKRPDELHSAVKQMMEKCSDPDSVELLFRFDDDDIDSVETAQKLLDMYTNVIISIGPRPENGYGGLHTLYNELYELSAGEFVWIYNDDVHFTSDNMWDDVLREHSGKEIVIMTDYDRGNPANKGNLFPIIHRSLVDYYGTLGIHPSIDVQWEYFSRPAGLEVFEPKIKVKHGMGCESEHAKDGLPATNPRSIGQFKDELGKQGKAFRQR